MSQGHKIGPSVPKGGIKLDPIILVDLICTRVLISIDWIIVASSLRSLQSGPVSDLEHSRV